MTLAGSSNEFVAKSQNLTAFQQLRIKAECQTKEGFIKDMLPFLPTDIAHSVQEVSKAFDALDFLKSGVGIDVKRFVTILLSIDVSKQVKQLIQNLNLGEDSNFVCDSRAIAWLADAGVSACTDPAIKYCIGKAYYTGQGIDRNLAKAREWLQAAGSLACLNQELLNFSGLNIPEKARGHEVIYHRFLAGRLVFKPNKDNDIGKIELPIAALANPLDGTFDLLRCGDTGKYLSIATGYRKSQLPVNQGKVEIWITPKFVIEKDLNTTAKKYSKIINTLKLSSEWTSPIGILWTYGKWSDSDGNCDHLTYKSFEEISTENLYENWKGSVPLNHVPRSGPMSARESLFGAPSVAVDRDGLASGRFQIHF